MDVVSCLMTGREERTIAEVRQMRIDRLEEQYKRHKYDDLNQRTGNGTVS